MRDIVRTSIVGGGKETSEDSNFFREGSVSRADETFLAPFFLFAALGIGEAMSTEHNEKG